MSELSLDSVLSDDEIKNIGFNNLSPSFLRRSPQTLHTDNGTSVSHRLHNIEFVCYKFKNTLNDQLTQKEDQLSLNSPVKSTKLNSKHVEEANDIERLRHEMRSQRVGENQTIPISRRSSKSGSLTPNRITTKVQNIQMQRRNNRVSTQNIGYRFNQAENQHVDQEFESALASNNARKPRRQINVTQIIQVSESQRNLFDPFVRNQQKQPSQIRKNSRRPSNCSGNSNPRSILKSGSIESNRVGSRHSLSSISSSKRVSFSLTHQQLQIMKQQETQPKKPQYQKQKSRVR